MFKNIKKYKPYMKVFLLILIMVFVSSCSILENNFKISISDENIVEIDIYDTGFEPNDLIVEKGAKIRWENLDSKSHILVIEHSTKSKTIEKGKSYSRTFDEEGEYKYYSKNYPQMKGVIIVK